MKEKLGLLTLLPDNEVSPFYEPFVKFMGAVQTVGRTDRPDHFIFRRFFLFFIQKQLHQKLCSEGVTFLGTELLRLIEEVLPAKFGGSLVDYELVEEEEGGLPKVSPLVSPRRSAVAPERVLATVYRVLRAYPGGGVMADTWQQGHTLRVVRREPHVTGAAKISPLHIVQRQGAR